MKKKNYKSAPETNISCIEIAAITINQIIGSNGGKPFDIDRLKEQIINRVNDSTTGKSSKNEIMLSAQAVILDLLFNKMVSLSINSRSLKSMQACMDIALRAQNQSRKTLIAINSLNHPQQPMFVKQQNVALNQQVNNGAPMESQELKPENELIRSDHNATLDIGRTIKTSSVNQNSKTVAIVNRSQD